MKQQQGVSYSINYVFTCGKRRVRICRNIYDQTNNTDNLVEVGSNGLIGGFRQDQSGKQCLHQQQLGVGEGQKKDSNGFGGKGIKGFQWVISSQKQLLSVGSPTQKYGEESQGSHKNLLEERKRGGCMKYLGQGQNLKKCECFECVSFMNQTNKCNLSSSSSTTSSSLQEGNEENSYNISTLQQNSVENLRLITDFYLHKVSEIQGILETHLLFRVEDTFIDLDDCNTTFCSASPTTQAATANKNYVYNRRILNGFLYKKSGLYVQFTPFTSPENQKTEEKVDNYAAYYPNSTDITLKNENFTFKFMITQTDQGFSVYGNLESRSSLVQIQQQQAYHVSVLPQEQQNKIGFVQAEQKETSKSLMINQQSEATSQCDSQKSSVDESADEDDDVLSSSLTIQINNNRHDYNSENELSSAKKVKSGIQSSSAKKSSMKKTPKLSSINNTNEPEKKTSKKNKRLQISSQYENEHQDDQNQEKKFLSATKKSSIKSHRSQASTSYNDEDDIKKAFTPQKLSKRCFISGEIDDEEDDEDNYEQNSWQSNSKASTQQHSLSQHKGYLNQMHNEEQNSSHNPNAPVQPKKNVVKNFVKAFRNFVNNWGDETRIMQALGVTTREELQNFRLEYKKFESIHKFNNTFIKALILNQPFKPVFNYFVNEEAWEWLDKSQVNNKKAHKDVLRDYIKATQDPSRIDEIHSLRTRNRQSSKKIKSQ
ncbi:hypothetical protein ABPG72_009116 [Tetrahymena utriculariae]